MCFFAKYKIKRLTKKIASLQKSRVHSQPTDEAIKKELALYQQLIKIYTALQGKKKYPFARDMILACYRAASTLEDAYSRFTLGKWLLEEAKYKQMLQAEGVFASDINTRQMAQLYEEAHAYLIAAEQLQHVEAKRLRGVAMINGWGVPVDKEKGFELVVDSIKQENAWDRVPQIFTAIGLNKPEFFTALMQKRSLG